MTVTTAPLLVAPSEPILRIGVPVPSGTRGTLDQTLPPPAVAGIESLWNQVEAQIFAPLLQTPSQSDLGGHFERLLRRFVTYHQALALSFSAAIEDDASRARPIFTEAWDAMERTLVERGPDRIGRDATLAAWLGVKVVRQVSESVARRPIPLGSEMASEFVTHLTAYMLASLCTIYALRRPDMTVGVATNAAVLAYWSKEYSLSVYDLGSRIGLRPAPPTPSGNIPPGDDEDRALANLGLEEYGAMLEHDEQAE